MPGCLPEIRLPIYHQLGRLVAVIDHFAARVLYIADDVVRTGNVAAPNEIRISAQQPQTMTDGAHLDLLLHGFAQEYHRRRLVLLTFFDFGLVSHAIHGIGADQKDAFIVRRVNGIEFCGDGNMLIHFVIVWIGAETQRRLPPQVREVLDLITLRGEILVEPTELRGIKVFFNQDADLTFGSCHVDLCAVSQESGETPTKLGGPPNSSPKKATSASRSANPCLCLESGSSRLNRHIEKPPGSGLRTSQHRSM